MKKFTLTPVLHFLLILVLTGISTAYPQENNPLRTEDYRYEDWYTFKHGKTFTVDPYVWVYTREFSQMFRMPEQWIDDTLKGALAVSFRMTTIGNLMCGYGGQETSCWPPLECQVDVYYDNRIQLPWTHEKVVRDFLMRGISSHEFLHDPSGTKGIRRYIPHNSKAPRGIMESMSVHFEIPPKTRVSGIGGNIIYYDREYQPDIGLVGFKGVCPKAPRKGYVYFFDSDTTRKMSRMQIKPEDAKPIHVFEFPETFMRRANVTYEAQNKPNKETTQELTKQFLRSRQPATKP